MWKCQSASFHGLSHPRDICIYLRLPWINLVALLLAPWRSAVGGPWTPVCPSRLPGALDLPGAGGPGAAFTRLLSLALAHVHWGAALTEQVYSLQKCTIARQRFSLWAKDFGCHRALASFARVAVRGLGSLLECFQPSARPAERQVPECLSRGHAPLAMIPDLAGPPAALTAARPGQNSPTISIFHGI
jgi:hypothetical protein